MSESILNLTYGEIFSRAEEGKELFCPKCGVKLSTIPEDLAVGKRPLGLFCPKNKDHYYVYAEDSNRVKEMRKVLDELAANRNSTK